MTLKKENHHDLILFSLISLLFALLLYSSFTRYFDHDEFEHIHSAWLALTGRLPYRDFFQHHNGALWIMLAPVIAVFKETAYTVFAARTLIFLSVLATAYFTYLSSKLITGSRTCGLFSILWLFSTDIFHAKSIEVRPEIPQTLFIILSFYFLARHLKLGQKLSDLALSFLFVSTAFIILQKTVLYITAYGSVVLFLLFLRQISLKASVKALPFALFPLVSAFIYLWIAGTLNDYWLTNWILNLKWIGSPQEGRIDNLVICHIVSLSLGLLISIGYIFCFKKKPLPAIAGFLGFIQLLGAVAAGKYLKQYFYPPVFFFAILGGDLFVSIIERTRAKFANSARVILTIILLLPPLFPINGTVKLLYSKYGKNYDQIEKIKYVLSNTESGDFVYDGDAQFNLFRNDLHYFWFSVKPGAGLSSWQKNIDRRFDDYDIHRLIKEKKPRIISDYLLDVKNEHIQNFYVPGKFGLYILKD